MKAIVCEDYGPIENLAYKDVDEPSPKGREVVIEGADLLGEGNGLDALPIPVSTPGFDAAPTLTSTNTVTRDPDSGVQNMGTYRAGLKATDRLVVRMATRTGGAGLGLAIVKKIMEDHNGDLIFENLEQGGARVSLVFRPAEELAAPDGAGETRTDKRADPMKVATDIIAHGT